MLNTVCLEVKSWLSLPKNLEHDMTWLYSFKLVFCRFLCSLATLGRWLHSSVGLSKALTNQFQPILLDIYT